MAAYVAANAQNARKGYRLGEISDQELLGATVQELGELIREPTEINEMADTLACLFHYCQRRGWTPEQIDEEVARKLALRFPEAAEQLERSRLLEEADKRRTVGYGRHQEPPEYVQDGHGFGHRVVVGEGDD